MLLTIIHSTVALPDTEKGFEMLPSTNDNAIAISLEINSDAGFNDTSKYVDDLCIEIREISDEIISVGASFGTGSGIMAMLGS